MRDRPFSTEEERFLLTQLQNSDPRIVQRTLQTFCDMFRAGRFLVEPSKARMAFLSSLHSPDLRVRRWGLNALTHVGFAGHIELITAQFSVAAEGDPDLMSSAVAALFSQVADERAEGLLKAAGVKMEGLHLIAAAQFSSGMSALLAREKIPLDHATPDELRAAIVLTGKRKAPDNLFFANHTNEIALSELNLHDVPSVAKYSLWAQANLKLGFKSIRINIAELDSSPEEVRKWVYALLFSDSLELANNLDLLAHVRRDDSAIVRAEAAHHLRSTFLPQMVARVLEWYNCESDDEVRLLLLEHMSAFAHRDARYEQMATTFFEAAHLKSDVRIRLEAAASGTPFYQKLRRIELVEEERSLFGDAVSSSGSHIMVEQNFYGGNFGAVTGSGNITAETIAAVSNVGDPELKSLFERVLVELAKHGESPEKTEVAVAVRDAAKEPSRSTLNRVVTTLTTFGKGVGAANNIVGGVGELIGDLQNFDIPG